MVLKALVTRASISAVGVSADAVWTNVTRGALVDVLTGLAIAGRTVAEERKGRMGDFGMAIQK